MNPHDDALPFQAGFKPADPGKSNLYLSRDGRTMVLFQPGTRGVRDLHAGILALALELAGRPHVRVGWLVVGLARLSWPRMIEEWTAGQRVLSRPLAARMRVAGAVEGRVQAVPGEGLPEKMSRWVQQWASAQVGRTRWTAPAGAMPIPRGSALGPTRTSVQVTKVLLVRWLRGQGPIGVGALGNQVGCSYPTAAAELTRLDEAGLLKRGRNRSVELTAFPADAWQELAVWESRFRSVMRYGDPTDREMPEGLLRRLQKGRPAGVALGGVAAGRWWDPAFDLHGMPRLDLVVHAPGGAADLGFVKQLDPGLLPVTRPGDPGILAVRPLKRAQPLFETSKGGLAVADPVETVLDLHDLGLDAQAGSLIRRLRPEGVFP